jgi:hypothetical protein
LSDVELPFSQAVVRPLATQGLLAANAGMWVETGDIVSFLTYRCKVRIRVAFPLIGVIAGSAVVVGIPAMAAPLASDVSPTTLPPSAPGRLAYSTGTYESGGGSASIVVHGLATIGLEGDDRRTLTDPQPVGGGGYAGFDHTPQWSPDGDWLAYLQDRPGGVSGSTDEVAVIPRDGGDPQVVDPHGWDPSWSPDGQHLAWVSADDDGNRTLMLADVQTTPSTFEVANRRAVPLPDPTLSVAAPVFSPDGQSLAFVMGTDISNNAVLYGISITGENLRQLSHGVAVELSNADYAFSPDGTQVLFVGMDVAARGTMWAYVADADGTNQRRVFSRTAESAIWAPAGDEIAVAGGTAAGIVFVNSDGDELGSIAQGEFSSYGGLTFSPDGTRIYSVASPASSSTWEPDLYSIPVDGSEPQRLTTDHSVFPYTVQAIDPGRVLREFGEGASKTAAAAVTDDLIIADTIVVSSNADYAASLTAAPLAAKLHAPALVTAPDRLSSAVVRAATRLHASHAVLVGDLSSTVASGLRVAGLDVVRVGNASTPFGVGAAVASLLASHHAFVVPLKVGSPGGWRLPLATAGFAALKHRPLLYARSARVPTATRRAIRAGGITSVTVVGGDEQIRSRLLNQLDRLGVAVHRLRSSDPYVISARLADRALTAGAKADHPVVSSGPSWKSSVTAPAFAALIQQVSVLVDGRTLAASKPTATWLSQHGRSIATVTLLGGIRAVRPLVEVQLEHRIRP